jgi:hypothetical protein
MRLRVLLAEGPPEIATATEQTKSPGKSLVADGLFEDHPPAGDGTSSSGLGRVAVAALGADGVPR